MSELIGIIASLAGIADLIEEKLRKYNAYEDAKKKAEKAKGRIAHELHQIFGEDAAYVAKNILSKDYVYEALVNGDSGEKLFGLFEDEYKEAAPAISGRQILPERVKKLASKIADILLDLGLNKGRALGTKLDAQGQQMAAGFSKMEKKLDAIRIEKILKKQLPSRQHILLNKHLTKVLLTGQPNLLPPISQQI